MKKILIFVLVFLTIFIIACSPQYPKEYSDKVANCLADKGVKEYGAFWCPNCAKQKKMFGTSYDIIMNRGVYIECDPRGDNSQTDLCLEKQVQKYPDWEFPDGPRVIGVLPLEELYKKAGCE